MSLLPIVASCEVLLSDDVLRDLFTRGTNFKKRELVARGGGPPVASSECGGGDGAGDWDRPSPVAALQFFSVQLEKQSDAVIKLFITVFRADSADQQQQTDLAASLSDKSVQGDSPAVSVAATQTDISSTTDAVVQTRERRLRQTFRNTYSLTDFNMSTQKDGAMMAAAESKASYCQAVSDAASVSVQTARNDAAACIQTDPPSTEDSPTQTDPPPISQVEVQTRSSMARESDAQMQASAESSEAFVQTDLIQAEADSQTDISIARRSDGEVQASAEMVAQPTQTDGEVGDGSSQTESSMSSQRDSESQCAAETSELSCQTESQIEDNSSQTTSSLSLEAEQETQTAADTSDVFSQTDADEVAKTTEQEAQMSSQESVDAGNDSVNTSQDLFTEIVDREAVTQSKRCGSEAALRDSVAQTDPVTIIIGDASFLVKKLKSSAVSPSKITTSGNEIEIELSADVAGSDAPFGAEEKENNIQRYAALHPDSFLLPRSGPMIRGGTPGVVARAVGGGGGVRVRMPTTMQSPVMTRVPVSRTQMGAQVRFQAPTVVARVPGPANVPRHGGRGSSGGTFSCPFCSLIFIDSPALYEHLSVNHQVDQKTKWKQPKGREGKTIIPRKQKNPENSPPVLVPVRPLGMQAHYTTIPGTPDTGTEDEGEDMAAHEAGLFEDPVETSSSVKRRRGRPKTRGSDLDAGASDDDVQTPGKRQRKDPDGASKRARVEEEHWEETEEAEDDGEEEEEEIVVKASRRGGRTPRTRTK